MAAKTLNEFYKQWREPTSGGFIRLFKDIRDQDVWDAATKAAEEKFTSTNTASHEILQEVGSDLEQLKWDIEEGMSEDAVMCCRKQLSICIAKLQA